MREDDAYRNSKRIGNNFSFEKCGPNQRKPRLKENESRSFSVDPNSKQQAFKLQLKPETKLPALGNTENWNVRDMTHDGNISGEEDLF